MTKTDFESWCRACESIGLPVPTMDRIVVYRVKGYPHAHRRDPFIRKLKRLQCCSCRFFVRDDLRGPKMAFAPTDLDNYTEDWAEYRLERFERWLRGCKAGKRPDIHKFPKEAPPKRKGGWWGTVGFPCGGYAPHRDCWTCRHLGADGCMLGRAPEGGTGQDNGCEDWRRA